MNSSRFKNRRSSSPLIGYAIFYFISALLAFLPAESMAANFKISAPTTWKVVSQDEPGPKIFANSASRRNERIVLQTDQISDKEIQTPLVTKKKAFAHMRAEFFERMGLSGYTVLDIAEAKPELKGFQSLTVIHSRYRDLAGREVQMLERQYISGRILSTVTYLIDSPALNDTARAKLVLDYFKPVAQSNRAPASESLSASPGDVAAAEAEMASLATPKVVDLDMSRPANQKRCEAFCKDDPDKCRKPGEIPFLQQFSVFSMPGQVMGCAEGLKDGVVAMTTSAWDTAKSAYSYMTDTKYYDEVNTQAKAAVGVVVSEIKKDWKAFVARVGATLWNMGIKILGDYFLCANVQEQSRQICALATGLIPIALLYKIILRIKLTAQETVQFIKLMKEISKSEDVVSIAKRSMKSVPSIPKGKSQSTANSPKSAIDDVDLTDSVQEAYKPVRAETRKINFRHTVQKPPTWRDRLTGKQPSAEEVLGAKEVYDSIEKRSELISKGAPSSEIDKVNEAIEKSLQNERSLVESTLTNLDKVKVEESDLQHLRFQVKTDKPFEIEVPRTLVQGDKKQFLKGLLEERLNQLKGLDLNWSNPYRENAKMKVFSVDPKDVTRVARRVKELPITPGFSEELGDLFRSLQYSDYSFGESYIFVNRRNGSKIELPKVAVNPKNEFIDFSKDEREKLAKAILEEKSYYHPDSVDPRSKRAGNLHRLISDSRTESELDSWLNELDYKKIYTSDNAIEYRDNFGSEITLPRFDRNPLTPHERELFRKALDKEQSYFHVRAATEKKNELIKSLGNNLGITDDQTMIRNLFVLGYDKITHDEPGILVFRNRHNKHVVAIPEKNLTESLESPEIKSPRSPKIEIKKERIRFAKALDREENYYYPGIRSKFNRAISQESARSYGENMKRFSSQQIFPEGMDQETKNLIMNTEGSFGTKFGFNDMDSDTTLGQGTLAHKVEIKPDIASGDQVIARSVVTHELDHNTNVRDVLKGNISLVSTGRLISFNKSTIAGYKKGFRSDELEARIKQIARMRHDEAKIRQIARTRKEPIPDGLSESQLAFKWSEIEQARAFLDTQEDTLNKYLSNLTSLKFDNCVDLTCVNVRYGGDDIKRSIHTKLQKDNPRAYLKFVIEKRLKVLNQHKNTLSKLSYGRPLDPTLIHPMRDAINAKNGHKMLRSNGRINVTIGTLNDGDKRFSEALHSAAKNHQIGEIDFGTIREREAVQLLKELRETIPNGVGYAKGRFDPKLFPKENLKDLGISKACRKIYRSTVENCGPMTLTIMDGKAYWDKAQP